jgi:photosystem II stability/assembly factor-like uncharacterized protein
MPKKVLEWKWQWHGLAVCLSLSLATFGGAAATWAQELTPEAFTEMKYRHLGPQGNRVIAVAGVPGDPDIYYVGAASGGIFKTEDAGTTWKPIFDEQPVSSIGSLAVAPSAPNVIWAGTGETFLRSNNSIGNGIYKSTDSGKTWEHMGLEATGRIGRIAIHPRNPDIVYAAALGHCYGPQPDRGVYRTLDGGETWERVLFVDEDTGAADIAMDPDNPDVLFAGTWQVVTKTWGRESGGPGSGLYRSRDGGTTWQKLTKGLPTTPLGKIGVAIAPSDTDRVYALLETGDGVPWKGVETSEGVLWSSEDGGDSWRMVSRDRALAGRANYYTRAVVSPDDEYEVYFIAAMLSVSLDGGATSKRIGRELHGDHHDMWIDPLDGERIIESNDGGIGISVNRGETWRQINLPIGQLYHVATDDRIPYFVYGNRQDGPSQRGPSNSLLSSGEIPRGMWHSVGGSESGFAIPDPVDQNIVWSGGYPGGPLDRYNLETGHARAVGVWPNVLWGTPAADLEYRFQWTFPIVISPHDHNRVYVGSQYVHQTTNGGQSWTTISPDLSLNDKEMQQISGGLNPENASIEYANVIFAIAESPIEDGVIWAGTNDGLVHVTRDGGTSWTNVTDNISGLPTLGTVSNIEPSRHAAGTAYLTVDFHQMNNRDPHVYKTADYGSTWSFIGDIPKSVFSYAHCVREDPVRPGLLYLGTENAIYVSFDDGESWTSLQSNLPHAPVHWLQIQEHFNDLAVATYGRGFWILDDLTPLQQLTADVAGNDVHLFAPRAAYRFQFVEGPMSQRGDTAIGENPPYGASINYYVKSELDAPVEVTILDASGNTVRTLDGSKGSGIQRVWWDLRTESSTEVKLRTSPLYAPYFGVGDDGTRELPTFGSGRISILVRPGTYTVKLVAGDMEQTQSLEVRKDPNTDGTLDDVEAQITLVEAIRDDLERVAAMINQIEWIRVQIDQREALAAAGENASGVSDELSGLDEKLIGVEENLFQMKLTGRGQDMARWPAQLITKLWGLAREVSAADFPPTSQQAARQGEYAALVAQHRASLDAIVGQDLAQVNAALAGAGLPVIHVVP